MQSNRTTHRTTNRTTRWMGAGVTVAILLAGCTQETQNTLGRAIQNSTGTDSVLHFYSRLHPP